MNQIKITISPLFRQISFLIFLLGLTGCDSAPDKELVAFVQSVRTQKTAALSPLPEFKNMPETLYEAVHLRNPFEALGTGGVTQLSVDSLELSLTGRPRDPLEHYPIESLKMVGYLEKEQTFWGLVKDQEGILHQVSVNQYIGQNNGKVIRISSNGIDIEERDDKHEARQITLPLSGP